MTDASSLRSPFPVLLPRLANELRRMTPHRRLHGTSVAFARNYEKRMIILTKTNPPEKMPSGVSNTFIRYCDADTFEEKNPLRRNSNP